MHANETLRIDSAVAMQSRPRLLMLTHRVPYPPDRGDRIRAYHLLRELGEHYEISLACTSEQSLSADHHDALREHVQGRLAVQRIDPRVGKARALAALARGHAATPAAFYRTALAQRIHAWHRCNPFDVVLTFCTGMIDYSKSLCGGNCNNSGAARPLHVLDMVDVDSLKWQAYAHEARGPMKLIYATEARRLARIERDDHHDIDAITLISSAEVAAYHEHVGGTRQVAVVENGVDLDYFTPMQDAAMLTSHHSASPTLCFTGVLNYEPNVDAVNWFARRVMPPLLERVPNARFRIVGRSPSRGVRRLGQLSGVDVVGPVDDIRRELRRAWVVVAPLRIARGVQNKVLEAMASSRAVVCTPAAATGIAASPGTHYCLADSVEEHVSSIAALVCKTGDRRRIAGRARKLVEQRYDWTSATQPMIELIEQLRLRGVANATMRRLAA